MNLGKIHDHLWRAYLITKKGKRKKPACLSFEMDADLRIARLARQLHEQTYVPAPTICFIHEEKVRREIFASSLEHRVICTLLFEYLYPLYNRLCIYDVYNSRPGKGPIFGVERFEHHMRSVTENYTREAWLLKLDIRAFFVSIDRSILRRIIDEDLDAHWQFYRDGKCCWFADDLAEERLWIGYLLDIVLDRDPTKGCMRLGPENEWAGMPKEKSLFNAPPGVGVILGDVASQLFSIIYLNRFDNFVKRGLGIRHYGRYVDDFYLMHNDREYLKSLLPQIRGFIEDELHLKIHPDKITFQPCCFGVTFLGSYCKPYVRCASKGLVSSFRRKISEMEDELNYLGEVSPSILLEMRSVLNSYCGYLSHYSAFNLKSNTFNSCKSLWKYFYFTGGYDKAVLRSGYRQI